MRRSTAVKALFGVLGFGLAILVAGREWQAARELLAASLVVGVFLAVAGLRARPRRRAMQAEARRLGLAFSATGRLDDVEAFALFGPTTRVCAEVENVLSGGWHGRSVRLFDYSYSESEDEQRLLSCAWVAIEEAWPNLVIRPETVATRLFGVALPDIQFESDRFNRAFAVRCEDRAFATALLDARMMEWLLALGHRWSFEIQARRILAYRDQVQPWEIEGVLQTLETFVEKIPRAVRSLYPAAVPPRPDVAG